MFKTLTRAALLAVVAGGLNLTVVDPAQAQPPPPADGARCRFTSLTDPTIEAEVQTGQINGGPMFATAPGATIKMRCTIQVGAANAAHNGADSCSVESSPGLQATIVPPTLCSYISPEGQPVYMCTQITVNGVDYYWDNNPPGTGTWVQSSAAWCAEATTVEILPGHLCTATLNLYWALGGNGTDPINPDGQNIFWLGPDGDMYTAGVWFPDCHPFGNTLPGPFFPDPLICPLGPDGVYGLIIIYNGDMYIDSTADMNPDPHELFWNCPPY